MNSKFPNGSVVWVKSQNRPGLIIDCVFTSMLNYYLNDIYDIDVLQFDGTFRRQTLVTEAELDLIEMPEEDKENYFKVAAKFLDKTEFTLNQFLKEAYSDGIDKLIGIHNIFLGVKPVPK